MKTCTKCKNAKEKNNFYFNRGTADKLGSWCKACSVGPHKVLRACKVEECTKRIITNNKSGYCTKHKTSSPQYKIFAKQRTLRYKNKNPARFNAKQRKASSKIRATRSCRIPKGLTASDKKLINMYYDLAAYLTDVTDIRWHVDHIIPLRGKNISGLHVPTNLRVIPEHENFCKGNKFV